MRTDEEAKRNKMGLTFQKILEQPKIDDIFNSALKILGEVGIYCSHEKTVDMLRQKGSIEYKNGRIYFNRNSLEECFYKTIKSFAYIDTDIEFGMGGHWHTWELCDPLTNMPRPASPEETVQMAKLSEILGGGSRPIPVAQGNINPRLNTLNSEKIAMIHTKTMGGYLTVTDSEEIKIISQMHTAAGRKYTLGLEGLISPLRLNSKVMDTYFEQRDNPYIDINIMGIIPMAGATAPLVFPANLSMMLAEALGLHYILQTVSDGRLWCFSFRLDPFDFKSGNIIFGSPMWCLFRQAVNELWEGLTGQPIVYGSFRSNAKTVDAQSVMERTASAMWQALLGVRIFGAVGQLSVDEVYSPVQAILDKEILKYLRAVFKGVNQTGWAEDTDVVNLVREGVESGGFLDHDTTVGYFRQMYDFDILSSYANLNTWRSHGGVTINSLAWEEAQSLIRSHDFILDDTKRRDVEKLYDAGVKYIENL